MPPLEAMPPIADALGYGPATEPARRPDRPAHPDPSKDGLALEVFSAHERSWWGHLYGQDVPELIYPLGWGEWGAIVYSFDPEPPPGTQEVIGRR